MERAVFVSGQDLARPGDGVLDPTTNGLRFDPQLEVFGSIVVAHAVAMVDGFAGDQVAAEDGLHHQDVLEDIAVVSRASRMSRCLRVDVPARTALPRFPASSPSGICRTGRSRRLAFHASLGLAAHRFATPRTGGQLLGDLPTARAVAMAARRIEGPRARDTLLHPSQHRHQASRGRHVTVTRARDWLIGFVGQHHR